MSAPLVESPFEDGGKPSSNKVHHHTTIVSKPCYLLDKMPAKLRNSIYEYAFGHDLKKHADGSEYANLLRPNAPSDSLLRTCLQVHSEARVIYRSSYRQYWTDTPFVIWKDNFVTDSEALRQ